jgi:hypothetical protein
LLNFLRLFGVRRRRSLRRVPRDWDSTTLLLSSEKNRARLELAIGQAKAAEPPQTVMTFPEAVGR